MAGAASKKSTHPLRFWRCFVLKVTMCLSRWDTGADRVGAHTSGVKQRSVTALLDTTLPQIPGRKVKELFRRFANKVVAGSNKVSLPTVPRRSLNAKLATSSKGNEFMENMMQAEMAARLERIEHGELITAAELGERLSMSKQAVSRAATTGRMFTLEGPAGKKVFPAFYSDPRLDRRVLERVSKELGQLPGPSKWQFFTTGKVSLDGKSPLEAISEGQVSRVLAAATAFREH